MALFRGHCTKHQDLVKISKSLGEWPES